jgi:hypothetical protein
VKLIDFVNKNKNHRSQVIYQALFDSKHSNKYAIFQVLSYRCNNLNPKMQEIVNNVKNINKRKN